MKEKRKTLILSLIDQLYNQILDDEETKETLNSINEVITLKTKDKDIIICKECGMKNHKTEAKNNKCLVCNK